MNTKFLEARELVTKAREALRRGDKESARGLGEKAALLMPEMEDAWLVLAASDPNPEDALAYAEKALEINPESSRAHRAVEWAQGRLNQARASSEPLRGVETESVSVNPPGQVESPKSNPPVKAKSNKRVWIFAGAFAVLACVVVAVAAWTAFTNPAFASILNPQPVVAVPTNEVHWAQVEIAKPAKVPADVDAFEPPAADTATPVPTEEPTALPTDVPTLEPTAVPTEAPTLAPEETETPGTISMEFVEDVPANDPIPLPPASAPKPSVAQSGSGTRWIDVDLTNQRVYAYEGETVVNSFIVSTGTWLTPTVTGEYKIYVKYRSAKMSGPGYYLPNVPYIMYFYKGYGLHGTYWHNNFGTPMSHGCVNLTIDDAAWLYNWASVGTLVNVHY